MRTTVNIDDRLLAEARRLSGVQKMRCWCVRGFGR